MVRRWIHSIVFIVAVCALLTAAVAAGEPERNFIVIDDFEGYSDREGERMYETWVDGYSTGNGALVDHLFEEQPLVHSGRGSLPLDYNNLSDPYYSEVYRTWEVPQDWTANGVVDLSLWLVGRPEPFREWRPGAITLGVGWRVSEWVGVQRRFGYRRLTGDGEIVARIDSLQGDKDVARVGVMVCESLEEDAPFAGVALTADRAVVFEYRTPEDMRQWPAGLLGLPIPHWVRLTRRGNTFTALHSANGRYWDDTIGIRAQVEIPMGETVYMGVYLWGRASTGNTVAELSEVALAGNVSPTWQVTQEAAGNTPDYFYVWLQDSTNKWGLAWYPAAWAVTVTEWTQWKIPLDVFAREGVDLKTITRMSIGVIDPTDHRSRAGGCGTLFIDDICLLGGTRATELYPAPEDVNVSQSPVLKWSPGGMATHHDIYFGTDPNAVANATPATAGIYRGRQVRTDTTYEPGVLEWNKTCYWRVDEVNEARPESPWKGAVWRFTTADFLVVDDFESYNMDEGRGTRLYETWFDVWFDGCELHWGGCPPLANLEWEVIHAGRQAMALDYNDTPDPWSSVVERDWSWLGQPPVDLTVNDVDTLVLFVRGLATNDPALLYVSLEDSTRKVATVVHPDPRLMLVTDWTEWRIPLGRFAGPDLTQVRKMRIGVGDPADPTSRALGRIYIDDIRVIKATP